MPRLSVVRAGVFGAALLAATAISASQNPVAFSTRGGDAWDFDKPVEVAVAKGRCDRVVISASGRAVVLRPEHGHVRARVQLQPGDNRIKAECRMHGVARGAARQNWQVRLRNTPTASIGVSEDSGGLVLDGRGSTAAPVRPGAVVRYQWRAREGNPAELAGLPANGARIHLAAFAPDGEYELTLKVTDDAGRSDESTVMLRSRGGVLRTVDPSRDHSAWIDRAVIYGVVPALFGPHGLSDVTARLDQMSDLGVTALWLSPITASPPGDFGYAVTDYFRLRAGLGGEQALRQLIRAAHARGIRVIIDVVPNHVSDQHRYFTDTIAYGSASPYFGFFARGQDGRAEHYFNWTNLENLNYANREVQRLVIEAFAHWVREFDVDGFRVDAAWGPTQRAPDFWPRWRAELKRIKPDLLLLAEASARDPYYGLHGFDAVYDWTDKLGEWAWHDAFEDQPNTGRRLGSAIEASTSDALVFRFLENNDTGARFRSRYGVGRTRVAAAMLLTLPGIPGLFSGQEIGTAYEPYQDASPLAWDDSYGLRGWYQHLIGLRGEYPALRSPGLRLLDAGPDPRVLAYRRQAEKSSDSLVVILNYGASPAHVAFTADALQIPASRNFVDLLSGEEIAIDGSGVTIAGEGVRILKPR